MGEELRDKMSSAIEIDKKTSKAKVMSIRGIGKSFGDFKAIKKIDLDLYEGEILGLLGPNGAARFVFIYGVICH